MDNVLRDINQAIAWLPKKTKVYRVSKDAALALKARICLFEGTYRRYHNIENDTKFLQAAYDAAGELMEIEYGINCMKELLPLRHITIIYSDIIILTQRLFYQKNMTPKLIKVIM